VNSLRTIFLAAALGAGLAFGAPFDSGVAQAQDLAIDIGGAVAKPLHLSLADLKAMAPVTVEASFHTGHGDEHGRYTGALLWTVLQPAGLADSAGNRPDLRHALAITGRDGYAVVLAFGEIDPDFADKRVIVAYEKDGKPTDAKDGLRLIVPGDAHGGRDVRDVVKIEVK
jgi:DMSO/TMAO reductase YedYZ molybdopterin-dependent catalytic subunit